jgi:hypothetical protein
VKLPSLLITPAGLRLWGVIVPPSALVSFQVPNGRAIDWLPRVRLYEKVAPDEQPGSPFAVVLTAVAVTPSADERLPRAATPIGTLMFAVPPGVVVAWKLVPTLPLLGVVQAPGSTLTHGLFVTLPESPTTGATYVPNS